MKAAYQAPLLRPVSWDALAPIRRRTDNLFLTDPRTLASPIGVFTTGAFMAAYLPSRRGYLVLGVRWIRKLLLYIADGRDWI
jgi:hypothetical protein